MQQMYLTKPVEDWYKSTKLVNIPDYFLIFGGFIVTALHTYFESEIVDILVPVVMSSFGLTKKDQDLFFEIYLPELRNATASLNHVLPKQDGRNTAIGAFLKIIHAFLWQEKIIVSDPIIFNPFINLLGFRLLPKVNGLINTLSNFQYSNSNFQSGRNVYPGETYCNENIPHAKWHLQSGLGLLDMVYLADDIRKILTVSSS